jgi:hypothetical protein
MSDITLARDPSCSAGELLQLSRSQDSAVLRALAQNPSTPLSVLLRLGGGFPDEFLQNPVLPLLLLEDPLFLQRVELENWSAHRFLLHPALPQVFFEDLCRCYLSKINKKLNALYFLSNEERSLLHDKRFPWLPLYEYISGNGDRCGVLRQLLFKRSERPAQELEALRGSDAPMQVRLALTMAKNTTAEMLSGLLCDRDQTVRWHALRHPNAPQDVLSLLYRAGANQDLNGFCAPQRLRKRERERLVTMGPFAKALWVRLPETPIEQATMGEKEGRRYDQWWLKALLSRADLPASELQKIHEYLHPPSYLRENVPIPNSERFPRRRFASCKEDIQKRRERKAPRDKGRRCCPVLTKRMG